LAFNGNKPFDVETRHALSLPKNLIVEWYVHKILIEGRIYIIYGNK